MVRPDSMILCIKLLFQFSPMYESERHLFENVFSTLLMVLWASRALPYFNLSLNFRVKKTHRRYCRSRISHNIGNKGSSSDLETGAEPHRLELEEEFGKNLVFTKKICEAKRFFSLSPVQRFLIYQKHEWRTKSPHKFLILRCYISKISLSLGGKVSHPIKFEVRALLCFFLFKKEDEIIFLGGNYINSINLNLLW